MNASLVRDGRPFAPLALSDFSIFPEAGPAIARLKTAGFLTVVVTNQPEVGRGQLDPSTLDEMHVRLRDETGVDDIFVCTCAEDDAECDCYKPKPGMLCAAAEKWNIDLGRSFMVGDRWRDIDCGRAAGCRTVFIDRGYAADRKPDSPHAIASGLDEACDYILSSTVTL